MSKTKKSDKKIELEVEFEEENSDKTIQLSDNDFKYLEKKIIAKYQDGIKDRTKYLGSGLLLGSVMNPMTVILILLVVIVITNNLRYIQQQGFHFGQEIYYFFKDKKT